MRRVLPLASDIAQSIADDIAVGVTGVGLAYQALLNLYSSGEPGTLIPSINDARADGRLYQDVAKTTLAVAADDPVAVVEDYSANDNHLTQSTATARPLLKQDANGNWYVQSDGTDDVLLLPTSLLSVDQDAAMVFAASLDAAGSSPYIFGGNGDTGIELLFSGTTATPRIAVKTTGGLTAQTAADAVTIGQTYIFTLRWDRSAGQLTLHQDRTKVIDFSVTPADIAPPSSAYGIFARGDDGQHAEASCYGAVIRSGTLDEAGIAEAEDYLAFQSGVTL